MSILAALVIALVSVGGLNLPAKTLDNQERSFPRDATGPRSIFVVTFSKSASVPASEWTRRLLERQAKLAATIYQVAVLEEVPGLFRSFVISALGRGVPQGMHDHFWVVTTDSQGWQHCVDSTSTEEPHVFVLDRRERIIWRAHGTISEDMLNELSGLAPPGAPNKEQ